MWPSELKYANRYIQSIAELKYANILVAFHEFTVQKLKHQEHENEFQQLI
jgi:hypothetical protein